MMSGVTVRYIGSGPWKPAWNPGSTITLATSRSASAPTYEQLRASLPGG
jgi:hypothetical protein